MLTIFLMQPRSTLTACGAYRLGSTIGRTPGNTENYVHSNGSTVKNHNYLTELI